MTAVSLQCKIHNHHPEWSNVRLTLCLVLSFYFCFCFFGRCIQAGPASASIPRLTLTQTYNTTFIRWTTHNPPGLTHKDITMAILADRIASDFTELEPQLPSSTARNLADAAAASARGCCGAPKK